MNQHVTLFSGSSVEAYDLDRGALKPWEVLAQIGMQPLNHEVP